MKRERERARLKSKCCEVFAVVLKRVQKRRRERERERERESCSRGTKVLSFGLSFRYALCLLSERERERIERWG